MLPKVQSSGLYWRIILSLKSFPTCYHRLSTFRHKNVFVLCIRISRSTGDGKFLKINHYSSQTSGTIRMWNNCCWIEETSLKLLCGNWNVLPHQLARALAMKKILALLGRRTWQKPYFRELSEHEQLYSRWKYFTMQQLAAISSFARAIYIFKKKRPVVPTNVSVLIKASSSFSKTFLKWKSNKWIWKSNALS